MIAHCLTGDRKTWLLILAKPLLCRLLVNHSLSVYPLVSMGSRRARIQISPSSWQGGWNELIFQLPSSPDYSMRRWCITPKLISLPGSKVTSKDQRDARAWPVMLRLQVSAFSGSRSSQVLNRQEQLKAQLRSKAGAAFCPFCKPCVSFPGRTCLVQIRTFLGWLCSRSVESWGPASAHCHICATQQTRLDLELFTRILCKGGISQKVCSCVWQGQR